MKKKWLIFEKLGVKSDEIALSLTFFLSSLSAAASPRFSPPPPPPAARKKAAEIRAINSSVIGFRVSPKRKLEW